MMHQTELDILAALKAAPKPLTGRGIANVAWRSAAKAFRCTMRDLVFEGYVSIRMHGFCERYYLTAKGEAALS